MTPPVVWKSRASAPVASEALQRMATCGQGPATPNYAVWGQRTCPEAIFFILFYF